MQTLTITLQAGQVSVQKTHGKYLNVMACSLPLQAAFNGGPEQQVVANQTYDKTIQPFKEFYLRNTQALAVMVTFSAGNQPANSQPSDNSTSNAATYAYGNLGIAVSAAAGATFTGSPACDQYGNLLITNAMALTIANINNGHRRQSIVFTMAASSVSAVALNVLDVNGYPFMTLQPGAIIELVTDSIFILSGSGGTAYCTVGQVFLANN